MPFWQYVLFIAYLGNALQVMRSYAEHRAHEEAELSGNRRRDQSDRALLFLSNNLHMAHHEQPSLPWYEIRTITSAIANGCSRRTVPIW